MDLTDVQELHGDGMERAAWGVFAQKLKEAVYGKHHMGKQVTHLVHYTTLDALTSMLGVNTPDGEAYVLAAGRGDDTGEAGEGARRRSYLRLYDTFSANDPNEGKFFVSSADPDGSFERKYPAVWGLFKDRSASPAYQTSLRQVEDAGAADNLVFWRAYGRDGMGCALVFSAGCLEGLKELYCVRYGEGEAKACLRRVEDALDAYSGRVQGAPDFTGSSGTVPAPIVSALSPLVYLYKSRDYEYEREARVVVPFSDLGQRQALLHKERARENGTWRHFAQLPELKIEQLLVTGSEIVYGPSVNVSPNLEFVLLKLLQQRGLYGPRVKPSRISYRA